MWKKLPPILKKIQNLLLLYTVWLKENYETDIFIGYKILQSWLSLLNLEAVFISHCPVLFLIMFQKKTSDFYRRIVSGDLTYGLLWLGIPVHLLLHTVI